MWAAMEMMSVYDQIKDQKPNLQKVLHRYMQDSTDLRSFHRLHCVLMVSEGKSCTEVSTLFGDGISSVERWVQQYRLEGIEGLMDKPRTGRRQKLTDKQRELLKLDLALQPSAFGYTTVKWSGPLLSLHIRQRFGIELSSRQSLRLLQKLAGRPPAPA